jgi:hypothetical protein
MSTILFRKSLAEDGEFEACSKYFQVVENRSQIPPNELVIGRYSVLPYYHEVEQDLPPGSILINSLKQHKWIANFNYYHYLKEFTPKTWFDSSQIKDEDGPFVVKGSTNSKKFYWDELMYAKDKIAAIKIKCRLQEDSYIGSQNIIFRKYIPLKIYEVGCNGINFANEWRLFYYKDKLLSKGYYWSIADEEIIKNAEWKSDAQKLLDKIVPIVSQHVNFYVLDIAETAKGDWILIEINDGQMSGLSENSADELYSNLERTLRC